MPCPATTGTSSRPTSAARSTLVRPQRSRAPTTSSRTSARWVWTAQPCSRAALAEAASNSSVWPSTVPTPSRKPTSSLAAQRPARASCSAMKPATGWRSGSAMSSGPNATTPRRPSSSSPSTTPRLASDPRLVWQNMSLTQVAPDSSSSAPLSMAPTRAISRVRCRPTGPTSRSPHSNRVRSSPMPQISASDRWVWPLTSPGSTTPWSSPTTSASGNRADTSANGPAARTSPPAKATAPPARSPAGPMVRTCPPRTTVVGLIAGPRRGGSRGARG